MRISHINLCLFSAFWIFASAAQAQEIATESTTNAAETSTTAERTKDEKRRHFEDAMRLDQLGGKTEARAMLKSSCFDDDLDEACHNFGAMAEAGEGGDADLEGARAAYKKGCELQFRQSCFNYANMLREGRGGEQLYPGALDLYAQICRASDGRGCLNAGIMVEQGMGVTHKDTNVAMDAYRAGCDLHNKASCDRLAKLSIASPQTDEAE
ncbi:MAG: tetratricopeptide repeat protein [Parasphingorhabdus sp.]|uniref:tetratricopeptide repeat protein n=1 Tax=Parasphingorhabdus sp. TaxID=2709688 RepID=UPI003002F3D3